MKRRRFLQMSASLLTAHLSDAPFADQAKASVTTGKDVTKFFESDDPEMIHLAKRVYDACVLPKVMPASGLMKHTWLNCGGPTEKYWGQWIWDSTFVLDLLSILPGKESIIRDVFQNFWDFQVRWNEVKPAFAHDMVACMIWPTRPKGMSSFSSDWQEFPAYSQIPILAWGVQRIYQRNGDRKLLEQCLEPLERFHEWYWRERDVTNIGLIAVGAYSGVIQHARYETFDHECNMDSLQLTRHPIRQGKNEGKWYGDICVTGNSSYLILAEMSLMRLAEVMGDAAMAARRKARIDKGVAAMRKHMWDEEAGTFLSVQRDTLEKIPGPSIGCWMPLYAGIATDAQAKRMAEVLSGPNWQTPLPLPTVARNDKRYDHGRFWRGDVWPAPNYQIASGLAAYGYNELAAQICDKTIANAGEHGLNERYSSQTGRGVGAPQIGMTCTVVTMMLDGLCKKHALKLVKKSAPVHGVGGIPWANGVGRHICRR